MFGGGARFQRSHANIEKRIKEDNRLAQGQRENYLADKQRHNILFANSLNKTSAGTKEMNAQRKQMGVEIELANRELQLLRRKRLAALLQQEARQQKEELAERGLAVYEDDD
eukprot:TRINITY_DN1445_c0_g1_i1.p1 TRINITY_DN1445_c0_g1~~TRINITY_DN1445_c0_g1_i1.p1  ORF type:complete len:112 (+),score=27.77 TRINITY_DN1445_c0_g1_i1:283-618(+)